MLQQSGHLLSGFRDNIDKRDLLAFPTVRVFHHRHRSPSHPHGHLHGHPRWRSSPWSSPLWRSSSRWSTASPMPMQVQVANSGPAKYKGLTDVVLSLYRFSIRISIITAIVLIITTIRITLNNVNHDQGGRVAKHLQRERSHGSQGWVLHFS